MKLKYYLRGLGMGIIFATLILTISSVIHNNNLPEDKIIEEAKKLGMVMPESETNSKDSLWGDATDSETDTEESQETQQTQQETQQQDTQKPETQESEMQESETQETETEDTQKPETQEITLIKIHVYPGDGARQVAQTLRDNGLIDDVWAFRTFLDEKGYAGKLKVGEFEIPVGASFEEITRILVN